MTTAVNVEIRTDWQGRSLPALVLSASPGADLAAWAGEHAAEVHRLARTAGAVLLRGFAVTGHEDFHAVMRALSPHILDYGERSSPRTMVSKGVYTSTEYPPEERILPHNEQSYTTDWPTRIVFFCDQPPASGGRTPLVDSRGVLRRLGDGVTARFRAEGVRYVRNYLEGISLPWQEAFQTSDRSDVDEYCRRAGITAEWVSEDQLRTAQVRPAIRSHPVTGEETWFNHAHFFHVSSLPQDVSAGLLEALDEEDLPYNTYYGDGGAIKPEVLDRITAAMDAETVAFDWERGDVLVVDNMITAHAREPFEGPRRILTAMSDPISATGGAA
ncbi:TauD/TfdA family dioxygenase [Lentzea sp. NPDC060358]|uniref:TauD/TfdA family dioxygenase n=1 Tax=Lentzea sp. NPDC060358 TaxID=3347103 RepID=UPI003649E7EE